MIYIFYVLMGISALVAVFSLLGVIAAIILNLRGDNSPPDSDGDTVLTQLLLSASLFCLAAIATQLWDGFPFALWNGFPFG